LYTDNDIRSEVLDNYRYAHEFWEPMQRDAQVYNLAAAGYTWTEGERKQLLKDKREPIEFNIMRRPLEFFSGYLRDNINQIIYSPVEGSDQKTSDQFTKVGYHVWEKGKGYNRFLSAADEMLKSGISLCGIQMDYKNDFIKGDIGFFTRTYNSFLLDPTFEQIDLEDCGFAITRDLINIQNIKLLLPFIDPSVIDDIGQGYRDDKFLGYHPQFSTLSKKKNIVAYDQYYKRTSRSRKFLIDTKTGFNRDISDMEKDELDKLKFGMKRFKDMRNDPKRYNIRPEEVKEIPEIEIKDVERPYIELHILLNGIPAYEGEDKTGVVDTYPFRPLICYLEPSIWMSTKRIQGIASCNWSLQRQFNKRHMKILDMMDSDISTGYKYLLGSVKNPKDLLQTGQNKLIGVDPDNAPEGLASVQELTGGTTNPAMIEYQNVLDKLSLTLSNINESVIGSDEGGNTQVSGRLAQVRIAQGLRGNRKIFDNIEDAQQELGTIILKAIQANYSPEKIERILNEKPTEQFYDKNFEQFDSVVKEGVRSKSQKDAYYYELINLKRDEIVDVPETAIIDALSMAGVSDLEEHIAQAEKMQAEQKAKIDKQEETALVLANSQAEANLAMAGERRARIQSDLALATERISESEENRAQAALAKAKTITEISSMNEDRIIKVLDFVNMLENEEIVDREAIGGKVMAQAKEIETTSLSTPVQSPQSRSSSSNSPSSSGGGQ